jgi:hypothetical protein
MSVHFSYKILEKPNTYPISLAEIKTHLKIDGSLEDDYLNFLIASITNYAESYTKREFITKRFLTFRNTFYNSFEIRRTKLQAVNSIKYLSNDVLETLDSNNYYITDETDFACIVPEANVTFPSVDSKLQAVQIDFWAGYGILVDSAVRASNIVTITTLNDHNFSNNDNIVIAGANTINGDINGSQTITVTGTKTFTYSNTGNDETATGNITANKIPEDLKMAMLNHIAEVYSNRGDCNAGNKSACDCGSAMNIPASTALIYKSYKIIDFVI